MNAPFGLTVTAEDGSGNTDTTYNGPVTLALSGGTSGTMLGGTVTVNAVNGVATFTGLTINTVGTGYTLTASSGTLTAATSPGINVAAAPVTATQLVVTTPPASVTANAPFGLTVTAEDGSGNVDTTYTGPVTLALSGGTSGAVLGGTVTGTAVNGVATFTGLTINTAGTGYTLTASSGTLTAATIPGINVAAPVTATQLVVTTPPASVTANAPFGLTVTAEDGSGNIATTYTGPVTLALSGGTSGAVLGGTVTVTAVNGVATFSGLTINTAGTGYTLTASSGTLTRRSLASMSPRPPRSTDVDTTQAPPRAAPRRHPDFTAVTAAVWCRERHAAYTIDPAGTVHPHRLQRHPHGGDDATAHFIRRRGHRGAECNRPRYHPRPRRGRHRGDDLRSQLHRRHGRAVWCRERHELHRRPDWHCDHCRQPSRYRRHVDITVTTPGGTSPHVGADTFQYVSRPPVPVNRPRSTQPAGAPGTSTSPTSPAPACSCAVNATSYTVDPTGTVITATSPAGTGVVDITVTTPQGTSPPSGRTRSSTSPRPPAPVYGSVPP